MAAAVLRPRASLAATLTAFGGGILFAAIALALVPEADADAGAALLAGILLGNVVESYGAALAVSTVLGGTVLADAGAAVVGTAQAVAAGAVLAVISIAIVPHAFSEVSRRVATATVAGFIVGYLLS